MKPMLMDDPTCENCISLRRVVIALKDQLQRTEGLARDVRKMYDDRRDALISEAQKVETLQNDIEGIIALATDLLDAIKRFPQLTAPRVASAAARLTVACAAYPLPSHVVDEQKPCASCGVLDGHDPDCPSLLFA